MVGPDIWAESFGGGKASCRARTLSFSHRTSLPSRSIIGNGKSLRRAGYTNQNLTAAQSHTLPSIPADSMCAAQYAADPDVRMQWRYSCDRLFERNVSTRSRHAGFLDRCRQFCSDRQNEISAAPLQDVLACPAAKKKTTTRFRSHRYLVLPWRKRMSRKKLSRRQFVAATALSSAALITAPYIRGAHAAGKLTMGFWDHWVPDANKARRNFSILWYLRRRQINWCCRSALSRP